MVAPGEIAGGASDFSKNPEAAARPGFTRPTFCEGPFDGVVSARIQSKGEEMKTVNATDLLETYRDVVARLHGGAVPTADTASGDFLDVAQSVEHQELARLTATRLAERGKRLQIALTRIADGEYEPAPSVEPPSRPSA
jgi:hypothetical protein